ncbi:pep-cterm sorting domain-containing protein [Anaeramoeba flamelloides]|uniref:Pep-cterm sorting domain-containing protein n=1 Tax=Anaeramoeba flamelloides TaxID=1746091 RepID=A0AAV8A0D2_9EUKA|nr:pep-cterm sorting domain-containing protein [Anaeramoeba flamelloides]
MNEDITIQQKEKYLQLSNQSNEIQKEINNFQKTEMIIKEIEICKKYNDYQEILDLKNNLENWKLNFPFDLNKTQINLPTEIQLENKLQFSILLKNQFNETINAEEFNIKAQIVKTNSNKIIKEIMEFTEGNNQESIGEYLFKEEGEYQINFSINDQVFPKSPFNVKVIEAGCNSNFQRRFNSRIDGWKYQTFHRKCDNKGKSIVLVKLKNKSLFGGFAAIGWDSKSYYSKQSRGNKSFLFSLISLDPNFKEPLKMSIYQNQNHEICCDSNQGPQFGGGSDLLLGYGKYNMNDNEWSYSKLGYVYKPPFGYKFGSTQANNFLAGSHKNWDISQIEIFCEK